MVLQNQISRINKIKETRDNKVTEKKLNALSKGASENGNVLELSIDAARNGATVGEISNAMEKVWKRHKAKINLVTDIYGENFTSDSINIVRKRVNDLEIRENRKPKIYIAKLGQDGHDRGQKVVGSALADMGFDVEVGPLFQTPLESASEAINSKADIIAASSLAAGHLTLIPKLREELDNQGYDNMHIIVGGVIPKEDYSLLIDIGASAIFSTGSNIVNSAMEMLEIIENSNS